MMPSILVQPTRKKIPSKNKRNDLLKCRVSTLMFVFLAFTVFSLMACFALGLMVSLNGGEQGVSYSTDVDVGIGSAGGNDSPMRAFDREATSDSNARRRPERSPSELRRLPRSEKERPATLHPQSKATIAYAVSLTSCGNTGHRSDPSFKEGAAVLKHSVHLSSIRNNLGEEGSQRQTAEPRSKYDYEMIVFVHPEALSCSSIFSDLGYVVQVRETPFNVSDIRAQFLREHVVKSGCCGEKEYLKLYAYLLFDYPIVVHLDLDSLILQPMDGLFDAMIDGGGGGARLPVMFNATLPPKIDAFFTKDYNMVNPGHKHVGVQGGFLIVRPSQEAFDEYIDIVLEGNFKKGNGWGGKGYGGYFGAQQIQGICSYFYDYRHPGTGVELNRCYYNAMADSPRHEKTKKCRDGKDECQDCRETSVSEIVSVHFTLCGKPWKCPLWNGLRDETVDLCHGLHQEWFRIREAFDRTTATKRGVEFKNPGGKHRPEIFHGYCTKGVGGYIPISAPS